MENRRLKILAIGDFDSWGFVMRDLVPEDRCHFGVEFGLVSMFIRDWVLKDYVMDIERYLEGKVLTWDYGTKFQQIDSTICNQDMKVYHDCKHVEGQDMYVK